MPTNDHNANAPDPVTPPAAAFGSIPRLRRVLIEHETDLQSVLEELAVYKKAPGFEVTPRMAAALACAASDTEYPLLDEHDEPQFLRTLTAANAGGLTRYTDLAIRNVQQALRICFSALESLDTLDALGEKIPSTWHNLPPSLAARRLNQLGHALLRGSVPGWEARR